MACFESESGSSRLWPVAFFVLFALLAAVRPFNTSAIDRTIRCEHAGSLVHTAGPPKLASMAEHHDIRMVAIDLDGTLLDSSKRICPRAAEALGRLPARGIKVVIASARPPRSVRSIYQSLGLATWQINYNGAMIWDEPSARVIDHCPLEGSLVREVIALARARHDGVLVSCEVMDRWFTDRFEQTHTTETGRLFKPDVIAPLDEFCDRPITKLMFLGEPSMMLDLEALLGTRPDLSIVRSDPDLIQIMHPRASKAAALMKVASHYGVLLDQVLALGDATNDIPMLQAAGVAVAMDNAAPAVKAVADWVAPSNDDHGVHAALVRYGVGDGC